MPHPAFSVGEAETIRAKKLNGLWTRPVQISFMGKPDAAQLLWRGKATRPLTIREISADSDDAAAASAECTLEAGGITIATITWAAGATVASVAILNDTIALGDVIHLTAPPTQDSTLADATIVITFQ